MAISTVHKVLWKILRLYACKIQIVQALEPDDRPRRIDFETNMLGKNDAEFLNRIMFSVEVCFHFPSIVNRHNVLIYGFENPHQYHEVQRVSSKVNLLYGIMYDRVIVPFFFN